MAYSVLYHMGFVQSMHFNFGFAAVVEEVTYIVSSSPLSVCPYLEDDEGDTVGIAHRSPHVSSPAVNHHHRTQTVDLLTTGLELLRLNVVVTSA